MRDLINLIEADWSRQNAQGTMDTAENGWVAVEKILKKQGFKLLAHGSRAYVYSNPKYPYVIKIFRHDPCYESFVAFSQANPNKHYPKFRGKLVNVTNNGDFRLVRIERLKPASPDEQALFVRTCGLLQQLHVLKSIPDYTGEPGAVGEFMWQMSHGVESIHTMDIRDRRIAAVEKDFVEMRARNAEFAAACEALFANIVTKSCRCDYAADNVMKRQDGTLVITDPLAPK